MYWSLLLGGLALAEAAAPFPLANGTSSTDGPSGTAIGTAPSCVNGKDMTGGELWAYMIRLAIGVMSCRNVTSLAQNKVP